MAGDGEAFRVLGMRLLILTAAVIAFPIVAHADPCEGRLPDRAGQAFSGTVRYVGDGDSLCVGFTSNPAQWIEVRLSDFNAPKLHARGGRDARDRLVWIASERCLDCTAVRGPSGRVIVHDRVIGHCRLDERPLSVLRAAGGQEGGR